MDEKQELLERIDQSLQKQTKLAKRQSILNAVMAVCCVVLIVVACTLLPQMNAVMTNLETVTAELSQVDFEVLAQDLDSFVTTSQAGVESAMDKLNAIDFETLNQAIEDLASVVEPLARFFNIFN